MPDSAPHSPVASTSDVVENVASLDAALSPVRRAVGFASRRGAGAVRFLEVTAGRWVDRALELAPAPVVSELLADVKERLSGFDALPPKEQDLRVSEIMASIAALDRLLGLPLPYRPASPRRSEQDRAGATGDTASGGGRRARRTGRRGRSKVAVRSDSPAAAPVASPPPPPPAPTAIRWSDDDLGGALIGDLELADDEARALDAAGLTRVGDLLLRRPVAYEVTEPVIGAGRVNEAGLHAVGGRIRRRWTVLAPDGSRTSHAILQGAGPQRVRWSGGAPDWVIEALAPGQRTVLVGQVEPVDRETMELVDPEIAYEDGKHAARQARYDLPGVRDVTARAVVHQALEGVERLVEPLPAALLERRSIDSLAQAVQSIHQRGDRSGAGARRLAYDEALLLQLTMLWDRYAGTRERGLSHLILHRHAASALQRAEQQLTDEQQLALEDIKRDLRAPAPMRRVLTGEVGAGKGLVALISTLIVADNKHQVFVLSPDAATAEQRFAFTEPALRDLGLVARLYTEPLSRSHRDAVKRGEVHVLYGTDQLFTQDLELRRLGLVVAGERDQFGAIVAKIEALRPPRPDLLVITSTPVPAPVLLAAYPAFDFTVLKALPGRPVVSTVLPASEREKAYSQAAAAVARGEQAMVVFPMVRGADAIDGAEALRIVQTLQQRAFPSARVRLFHGAMSRDERYATWAAFRDRSIDVLLTTTHFEAGPAVPAASHVIVEQADRMSLSRLHRVRGHVSVSRFEPACLLIAGESPDPDGLERIRRFAESDHGFQVAEQELEQRGIASMVAVEAPRRPPLAWVDLVADIDLLLQAREDARQILEDDPGLRRGAYVELARYLRARWADLSEAPCPVQVSGAPGRRRRRRRR